MKYLHACPPWYALQGPGQRQPNIPLGAAYLARIALELGWSALIWNGDLLPIGGENQYSQEMLNYRNYLSEDWRAHPMWAAWQKLVENVQPDVVGITSYTASHHAALHCAQLAKEVSDCKVILGGPHVSALPLEVSRQPNVDAVVVGEGEMALRDLLKNGFSNSKKILYGTSPKTVDDLGWPARGTCCDPHGLLKPDHYGLIFYSRACPFECGFCASRNTWGRAIRWRSAQDQAAEMLAIHKQYGTRYFSFEDDTFTTNRKRTLELMDTLIETRLPTVPGFRWTCNTRPDLVDAELLDRMVEAGCAAIAVGIEFGSERMLKKSKKAFTKEDVRQAVKSIKAAGLMSSGQFMIGYPTETEEEMWQTVELADEVLCESVMLSVATPLPATPLYDEAVALGLISADNIDWREVTTKNDGMLMTIKSGDIHVPMPIDQRIELVSKIQSAFDAIQAKTLEAKNNSRFFYESQYIPEAELMPVYGMG